MQVILEAVKHACKNGLMTLSKHECDRNGRQYVLDAVEKEHPAVPLKNYLVFGMECASMCSGRIEEAEKLLENKYFVNGFAGSDAVTACIYWIGIRGILQKSDYLSILAFFMSLIPDAEEDAFEKYAEKLDAGYSELIWGPLPLEPKQKM